MLRGQLKESEANVAQPSSLWGSRASRLAFNMYTAGWKPAGHTAKMAVLQQVQLCVFRHRLGETNADANQAHGFASSPKCFF